jgi:hypothetical protein
MEEAHVKRSLRLGPDWRTDGGLEALRTSATQAWSVGPRMDPRNLAPGSSPAVPYRDMTCPSPRPSGSLLFRTV